MLRQYSLLLCGRLHLHRQVVLVPEGTGRSAPESIRRKSGRSAPGAGSFHPNTPISSGGAKLGPAKARSPTDSCVMRNATLCSSLDCLVSTCAKLLPIVASGPRALSDHRPVY